MRRIGATIAILVAAALLTACIPAYEGAPGTPRVGFVSDSVLGMTDDVMIPNLRLDHQVSWSRTNAAKVVDLQGVATEYAGSDPDVVVISAGTNDVFARLSPSQTIAQLQAMVAKFSKSCVTIVTLNTNVPDDDIKARSQQVNNWIRQWSQVADWDAWVTGYYANGQPFGPLFYDMIHVTPAGKPHLANVVNTAARRCLYRGWPFGSFDSASSPSPGSLRLQGWAVDADTEAPITVHAYIDGVFVGAALAGASRPDVGNAFAFGENHGFDLTYPASRGRHTACVYAINVAPQGNNNLLSCRAVNVS